MRITPLLLSSLLALTTGVAAAAPDAAKAPVPAAAPAAAAKAQLTWYGHAAFRVDLPSGKVLLVDPWITNPSNPKGKDDLAKITKADLILVTHGHFDHVGDAAEIAKKTKAKLVATFDLGNEIVADGGYPKDQYGFETAGNAGGTLTLLDGEVAITFIPAVHSSAVTDAKGGAHAAGAAGGFVIAIKNGPTLYHTGDTDLFADMALVGKYFKVDYMLACVGDHFTMGGERAAEAVRLVGAKQVIPMHFGTFPVLTGTVEGFKAGLKKVGAKAKLVELKIDEPLAL